ncbi:hypothetical protein AcW1_006730 [Taiwanofungus camphoratus]|nr:hypothetical protein AcV5_009319 [Antrodia cinnamomea]KAI0924684.1 hypothetical protein AcW2_005495 [Antrodia cinnamomea]KAI0953956.1 hypothetical protein AcV7_007337 [Antrodia cinnamomea]KAI0955019.1 hypothetical protein AcW1_006730 [Antrodia cinnamomea]
MPSLELKTNVALADPKSFVVEFGAFAAKILDKPLPAICVSYDYNETLTFNGTFDPAFQLVITSLFNLNPEANQVFSKAFFDFFEEKLGVPGDRGYMSVSKCNHSSYCNLIVSPP